MENLPDLFEVRCGNLRLVVRPQNEDLLMGQSRQYLANEAAADAEHLDQPFLAEAASRGKPLVENGVEDLRVNVIHRRRAMTRARKRQGNRRIRGVLR
ncbi:hypothetical protein D3C78_1210220 [compost metagenome]